MATDKSLESVLENPEIEVQKDALDKLWEEYLGLLDEYQKSREELSRNLSSGFISLAQANFASTGRGRYGQDYYDERMQASRTINVDEKTEEVRIKLTTNSHETIANNNATIDSKDAEDTEVNASNEKRHADEDTKPKAKTAPIDPVHWFGVLIPPSLRASQTSFTKAVESSIPKTTNTAASIRAKEIEIGRLQKAIRKLEKNVQVSS